MNILLVGASGFVGRHLLNALAANGHQIIATSRRCGSVSVPGVAWQTLDLGLLADNPEHFQWPENTELLINAAGLLSVSSDELDRVQSRGTCALFDLAAKHGARVLQISALGAGEQPDIPFLETKAVADQYLLGLGSPVVILRPSLLLGAGGASSGWLSRLSPLPLIALLDLNAQSQPLHIDDFVGAVLALLRSWPTQPMVLPVVGPQPMTLPQVIDQLRDAQGWAPARYMKVSAPLAGVGVLLGDQFGWRALNKQSLKMAGRDNLGDPEPLASICGYRALPVASRLIGWPQAGQSVTLALRPIFLAVMILIWLGTAAVCLGPGYEWGLRIMSEAGITGGLARLAVISGALLDGVLGLGLLATRWRRLALRTQLGLMLGYTAFITVVLPHYWFDPYAAVAKNLVLIVVTLWLLWTEPRK